MRAIPSPQESTRPVSRMATEPSKPLISLRKISLISAGLISAIMRSQALALAGEAARSLGQAGREASIVDFTFKLDNYAAQQRAVDVNRWNDLFVRDCLEFRQHPGEIRVRGRLRKGERGP